MVEGKSKVSNSVLYDLPENIMEHDDQEPITDAEAE